MRDTIPPSRRLQLAFKITAIACGCILLFASARSESASSSLGEFLNFIAEQVQSTTRLQWVFGIIFLSAGAFFVPVKTRKNRSFIGQKELNNDSYVLYLVDKYQIEKNLVLNQLITCDKIFSNADEALAFAHEIECPREAGAPVNTLLPEEMSMPPLEEDGAKSIDQLDSGLSSLRNPFSRPHTPPLSSGARVWDEAKRIRVTVISGALLFTVVLGGLFYANSHSARNTSTPVAAISPSLPLSSLPNSDQVISGSIVSQEVSGATESKETAKPTTSLPINERWIGLWVSETGGKQKLLVTANVLKFNDEEFAWTGIRPKGVVQCCLAFYEGATTKGDLLARISGAQDPGATLKPESQKTLALVNSLSEGNFKRIVFADPYLKKYFFIYDQNYVYRVSRDLGDKVDVVVEQFKKQE